MSETTTTTGTEFIAEKFRYIELLLFMLVGIVTQIVWVSFSPIMGASMSYYNVDELYITILAASFMFVYIFVNGPCTKLIDKYGLKNGVGIGVILTGVGGLIRAIGGPNYWICFVGQILAAIGQPFVLNSFTKLGSNWFLESEKTTAAGLGSISTFIGVIIAMLFPELIGYDIGLMLWIYAIIGIIAMVLYLAFAKDKPKSPPNKYADKDQYGKVEGGIKVLLKNKDFVLLLIMVFIGLGAFNVITAIIDLIFTEETYPGIVSGNISAIMIVGGILGAMIISTISDSMHKRKIFMVIAFIAGVPLSFLMGFLTQNPTVLYILAFIIGFTLVSLLPVGTTYGAEITYPIPEEQSNGLLMTVGQISGILFLIVPPELFMYFMAIICAIGAILSFRIHDTDWFESKRDE